LLCFLLLHSNVLFMKHFIILLENVNKSRTSAVNLSLRFASVAIRT
jgi:hypothetical protein